MDHCRDPAITEAIRPCTPQGEFGPRPWPTHSTSARHRIRHGIRHTEARTGRASLYVCRKRPFTTHADGLRPRLEGSCWTCSAPQTSDCVTGSGYSRIDAGRLLPRGYGWGRGLWRRGKHVTRSRSECSLHPRVPGPHDDDPHRRVPEHPVDTEPDCVARQHGGLRQGDPSPDPLRPGPLRHSGLVLVRP